MTLGEVELRRRFKVFKAKAGNLPVYVLSAETTCVQCRQTYLGNLLLAIGEGKEAAMADPLDDHCPRCREAEDARQRRGRRT